MKKLCILVLLGLFGCVRVIYDIENIKPNEIGADEKFDGKIFAISCSGNDAAGPKDVDGKCREYASKFAYEKGYLYFSVLDSNSGSDTSVESYTTTTPVTTHSSASAYSGGRYAHGSGTSTTYVPQVHNYTVTRHYKGYAFVLIDENEIKDWKNYYRVLDYYAPEQEQ